MPDFLNSSDLQIEALSMYRVLEGLIHNINTPLNVIIGYSQQLKKQYPEITYLENITEAGLHIDDLVQSCSRKYIERMDAESGRFELKQWLIDEVRLLKNILEIKHTLKFEIDLPEQDLYVISNPMLLGLFVDSIVLQVRAAQASEGNDNLIKAHISKMNNGAELVLVLPEHTQLPDKMTEFLAQLQNKLEQTFHISFTEAGILKVQVNGREVKILLTCEGEA